MMPQVFLERFRIQVSDMVGDFLGRNIQRNLGQEQVRAYTGGGAYTRFIPHCIHQHYRHFFGRTLIHFQVRCDIDKAFVNGIDMDVFGRNIAQINPVNLVSINRIHRMSKRIVWIKAPPTWGRITSCYAALHLIALPGLLAHTGIDFHQKTFRPQIALLHFYCVPMCVFLPIQYHS